MSFVHLHVHSHYSLLDGLPKIPDIIRAAEHYGMPAVALTDHGVMYGCLEFYNTAKKAGLKPIIGIELYLTTHELYKKRPRLDTNAYHLLLLAADEQGYRNLLHLTTIANVDGFYYKPRIDKQTLERYHEGLICLSGCPKGEIPHALTAGNAPEAQKLARYYRDLFGNGKFYIELQRHNPESGEKAREENALNNQLIALARAEGLPIVATNDCHYLAPTDQDAQDALVCIQTGKVLTDTNRLSLKGYDLSFASPTDMRSRFEDLPQACDATVKIAERCNLELTLGKLHFPSFALPEGTTAGEALSRAAHEGLRARRGTLTSEEQHRLGYELNIINEKGFSSYFLVVSDFVNWAKERGIVTTTRGSAAGSLVSYAIGITTLNPLEYKLPFERFLNPERPYAPDIDVDLADDRRDEVIEYVIGKYGRRSVAKIVTFGTLLARAAVRDITRVLDLPYSFGDRIAKLIPIGSQGFPMTIAKALELSPELRDFAQSDPRVGQVLTLSQKVESCARHASVHAAGVVIAPTILTDFVPVQLEPQGSRHLITQYDMASCEMAGLVKIDFLGIRNLSILEKAIKIIEKKKKVTIDLEKIPLDDSATFALLAQGETIGLFQLGGSGMTRYLRELKPSTIFDIMAMVALYRPGPMESIPEYIQRKHGTSRITYLDPRLKDILEQSYGIIVYQDDVLMVAIQLAGYSWLEADKLRKAMGKKIPSEMAAQREKFLKGCQTHGKLSSTKANKLWSLIEPFAAYGFNKAHAASYARVAYQTAYLKAHFAAEFMTAVLTCESGNNDKIADAVKECSKMNIKVLPPDINTSRADFTCASDTEIRFGLTAIKNLGSDVIHGIIHERKNAGHFRDITDFLIRLGDKNLNKRSLESLIKSGALESLGERHVLLSNLDRMLLFIRTLNKKQSNQASLFEGAFANTTPTLVMTPANPVPSATKLSWEKELLGLYVSDHPLGAWEGKIPHSVTPIDQISENAKSVYLAGVLTSIEKKTTRKGETMLFAQLEDLTGQVELVVFPGTLRSSPDLWQPERCIYLEGTVSDKDGVPKILVNAASLLDQAAQQGARAETSAAKLPRGPERKQSPAHPVPIIRITLPSVLNAEINQQLKALFAQTPGPSPVRLQLHSDGTSKSIDTNFSINYNDEVKEAIEYITGSNTVVSL